MHTFILFGFRSGALKSPYVAAIFESVYLATACRMFCGEVVPLTPESLSALERTGILPDREGKELWTFIPGPAFGKNPDSSSRGAVRIHVEEGETALFVLVKT